MSPARISAIATNTVREAIRNKLLYTLLFFAVAVIGCAVLVASLSYVEGDRIIQDVGLASIRLFSLGIAIFVGIGLIHNEVERRTIQTILSKPVSRADFLLGKYFGLLATVWLQVAIMGVAFVVVSLAAGAPLGSGIAWALVLFCMELAVIVAVATLFSAFTTPLLASLFTVGIWLVGHLTRDLLALGKQADQESVQLVTGLLYRVLPDLEAFNLSIEAVHGLPIAPDQVVWPMLLGVGYSIVLLFVATQIFQKRDMK
jgi:ABC-type transport system involved in multi-copper enzyme maturation permease subunit